MPLPRVAGRGVFTIARLNMESDERRPENVQPIAPPQPPTSAIASRLRRFCSGVLLGMLAVLLGMAAGSLIAAFVLTVIIAAAMRLGEDIAFFLTFGIAVAALVLT